MAQASQPAAAGTPQECGAAAVTERVHAAFDALTRAAAAAPRPSGPPGAALRRPLGRIVSLAQYRDIYDQRIAHIREAEARAAALDAATRSAVACVAARLLGDLAAIVEGAGGTASDCFLAIGDLADACGEEERRALARIEAEGCAAAEALMDAAAILADEAEAMADRVDPAAMPEDARAADLGWMTALYTMEDERLSHDTALAAAAAARSR